MPFKSKECEFCHKAMVLTITRDLQRKKFCSRSCRQRGRYLRGEFNMSRLWEKACTPEANAKKVHRGTEHPRYKADRTQIKSSRPRYELTAWRKSVFERDDFTCQKCGQHGGKIQAHHIKSYHAFPDLRWELMNGETLCASCHKATGNYGSRAIMEVSSCHL